ncbi:TetR/AcrR family transcriptional regulator [Nocardia sp. NPDC003693]
MGRPRQFDESELLDAATELFWTRGFDGTSVQDVSRATGVGNGSIYSAYGTKRGLFLAAFDRYCDQRAAFVRDVVSRAPGSARDAVRALFEAVIADCAAHPDQRGCLMINSVAELATRVPEIRPIGARTIAAMEQCVAERLRRTDHFGDDAAGASAHGATIVVVAQGLIQLSRLGTPGPRLHEVAQASWQSLPASWADA